MVPGHLLHNSVIVILNHFGVANAFEVIYKIHFLLEVIKGYSKLKII